MKVFKAPEWVPNLAMDPPDSIPICDFMLDEAHGRRPLRFSSPPFSCGMSGQEYSAAEVSQRVDYLARALAKQTGWEPNAGSEWDKVVGLFTLNTVSVQVLLHPYGRELLGGDGGQRSVLEDCVEWEGEKVFDGGDRLTAGGRLTGSCSMKMSELEVAVES